MLATNKIKWSISIILGGLLLVLALIGGNWGTSYAASAPDCAVPSITLVNPSVVPSGSPDTVIVITGSNFGNIDDTRVRLQGSGGLDVILTQPLAVYPTALSVTVTDTLLTEPNLYILTVVKSCHAPPTIPVLPLFPDWDVESNEVPFTVYAAEYFYLPIIATTGAR
ncbi:MAG: hypothetical protein A2Z71_11040 [Chloroflexi bacterium RBG_13_50_21]|nr:MAG: hypothetical protein A2Z71_11040 [Chloroflexi bacterium RBG_13_50_21]